MLLFNDLHQNMEYLTFPAVSHRHFAPPGLSNRRAGYCVPWWFLHNMPCASLQPPLEATCFVSPGARPPLTPLAHLTAL